ncbi:glyoxylate/succinic semialdehyde reductase 2, chloroplastic [Plakobranchus ocellatus]|uniref:Glyoxylate/succinic semialdehyde reductase 2, chloroplastic n=1 Tax=Plakobranchus ocellatus TaxID=259542 RepID=A0AAV3YHN1_9GAST|nr:glyoxylate/succinic semialdehyde reductase 2, chloroplastic [Plakobranchus ocellatus]
MMISGFQAILQARAPGAGSNLRQKVSPADLGADSLFNQRVLTSSRWCVVVIRKCVTQVSGSTNTLQPTYRKRVPARLCFMGLNDLNTFYKTENPILDPELADVCREFVKAGALKGNNPADVVQSCDITFTCVADSTAVRDIMFGNMGVLDGISKGKCYVEMSTVDEETVQDVADAIMVRGGAFLEAPVCGSRVPALEGQLLILASGDRKLFDDCYSCFEAMGKKSFYLGNEVGTATRMKLIHNMILGNMVASLAEGMALADKVGIDLEDFSEVLSLGSLSCRTINHKSQAIMNGRFDPHFPLQHQQKDLRLVLGLGDSVEQPLHLAAAANELYKKARRMGYGEGDVAAVFKAANEFGAGELAEPSAQDLAK